MCPSAVDGEFNDVRRSLPPEMVQALYSDAPKRAAYHLVALKRDTWPPFKIMALHADAGRSQKLVYSNGSAYRIVFFGSFYCPIKSPDKYNSLALGRGQLLSYVTGSLTFLCWRSWDRARDGATSFGTLLPALVGTVRPLVLLSPWGQEPPRCPPGVCPGPNVPRRCGLARPQQPIVSGYWLAPRAHRPSVSWPESAWLRRRRVSYWIS